jgi:tetratricopeptide (TPR) repeat protein
VVQETISAQDAEWRRIFDEAMTGLSLAEQQAMAESEQFTRQGMAWMTGGDFEKARECFQRALQLRPRNLDARKRLAEVNALIIGADNGEAAARALDILRIEIEQALVEIANHVRLGDRLFKAREFEAAAREFEEADFKIKHMPYEVGPLREIEPRVGEMLKRAKAGK